MFEKKYYSISEVSEMLNIKEHVIRHWDSVDPKTKKLRIEDLSIRTNGGTRFFNKSHIKKIINLKKILEENGKRNYSLELASKILSDSRFFNEDSQKYSGVNSLAIKNDIIKLKLITNNLKKLIEYK